MFKIKINSKDSAKQISLILTSGSEDRWADWGAKRSVRDLKLFGGPGLSPSVMNE